jgi:hypothetical protein
MNLCRSCKFWSRNAHFVGMGACVNQYALLRVNPNTGIPLITAQDFGCILHEEGPGLASLQSPEEQDRILSEFYRSQHPFPLV